jgi:hypothetical protein
VAASCNGGVIINTTQVARPSWPTRFFSALTGPVKTHAVTPPAPDSQPSPIPSQLRGEVSVGRQSRFSPQVERPANPDELVGRKGLPIYTKMQTDDAVKAAMTLKKHAVISTGWDIAPATTKPIDIEAAEFVKYTFEQMQGSLDEALLEILSALPYGFSLSELIFAPFVSGQFSGKIGLKAIKSRLPHGFAFVVDAHDNLLDDGIEQFGRRLPTQKFILYSYDGEHGNKWGRSDLRAAYDPWWMKQQVSNWWGIFMDRYGIPLAEGIVPSHGGVPDGTVDDVRVALDNLQAATSFVHGDDIKLQFPTVSINGQGAVTFERAINISDMRIARALLLPNLLGVSATGDTGSFAQARKQFDVFVLIIEKLQRDLAEAVMGEQVIRRLIDLNYQVERYPAFVFLPFTESNKAQLLGLWFQAIKTQAVHPRPEDEAHIRMMTEFPPVPFEDLPNPLQPDAITAPPKTGMPDDEDLDAIVEQVLADSQRHRQTVCL